MAGLLDFFRGAGEKLQSGDLDLAMGLLAASQGPPLEPRGIGQVLLEGSQFATHREAARARNDLIRSGLEDRKRRREAIDQLPSLLNSPTAETAGAPYAPESQRQQRMLGLLGDIAPDQLAGSLLAGKKDTPRDLQLMEAFGLDPTLEGYREFIAAREGSNPGDLIQQQVNLAQLEKLQRENRLAAETESEEDASAWNDLINTVDVGKSLLESNNALEGTFLETGQTFAEVRKALLSGGAELTDLFGGDSSKAKKTLTEFNTFQKDSNIFATNLIQKLENATNGKFDVLQKSIPNVGVDSQTNRRVLKSFMKQAIQEAEAKGITIPPTVLAEINAMIESIDASETSNQNPNKQRLPNGVMIEILEGT